MDLPFPRFCSLWLLVAAAAAETAQQQQQPKCRGLKITEFITYLQTEVGAEFDLSPTVAERLNMSMEQLVGRAQGIWEGATRFEYGRAVQAELDGGGADDDNDDEDDGVAAFPYILCSKDDAGDADRMAQWSTAQQQTPPPLRKKSGHDRRLLIQDAIVNATASRPTAGADGFDGSAVVLKDMFNARGVYCAVASLPASVAMAVEFEGCVVQPMLLATKLGVGTITLAVAFVNEYENSTKIDLDDVSDDLQELIDEQVDSSEAEADATAAPEEKNFPGAILSLCPGFLSEDDVFHLNSGKVVKQKKVQRIMTEWLLSRTADGEDTTARVRDNLYWTSSSRDSGSSTTTGRGKLWEEILDRVSEPNICAQTFKKRLTWYLEPGLSQTSFTNLHVTYDNVGASKTDHDCILAAIAGFSVHPDICFFEYKLDKSPQIEYQRRQPQRLRLPQHSSDGQRRQKKALHRPNVDWMIQSYVEQARPFFDTGINGTGVVVAVR